MSSIFYAFILRNAHHHFEPQTGNGCVLGGNLTIARTSINSDKVLYNDFTMINDYATIKLYLLKSQLFITQQHILYKR